jgi:hypothetical protein
MKQLWKAESVQCTGRQAIDQNSKLSGQEKGTAPPIQKM